MLDGIVIRHLSSQADYRACVELQRETWGQEFRESAPASILLVSQKLGGVAAGAFDATGKLIGFVFGMTGAMDGALAHWSDMLAVRPEAQNLGIGRRLKEFQRAAVDLIGAPVILWTYDPLVARNAHLNFNVFGVLVREYARDMYGEDTGNEFARGIGTDRLVVAWRVKDAELIAQQRALHEARESPEFRAAPVIGDVERPDGAVHSLIGKRDRLRLAIPLDISVRQTTDPVLARAWRAANRGTFEAALHAGYRVAGFYTDSGQDRGYYLLTTMPRNAGSQP